MSNLTVDGDSNYSSTGTPDTFTPVSDGPSGTEAVAAHINGIATAITELQALLGDALTLKGSVADLVTRLSRVIHEDGAIAKGTSFPGTPIDGQPFYRTDLNTLYIYDAGTTSWTQGLDDGTFALIDGTREFTGDVKIEKSTPAVRLRGTEASADDVLIREDTGVLYFYRNTGSENAPSWTEFFRINAATGDLRTPLAQLTGSGNYRAVISHTNTADRTYTFQDQSYTVVGRDTTDTLTNKTLTNPSIGGATITGAAPATPTANVLYTDSLVKGFVAFQVNGTIDTDFNVSSITDNGVGDWTVNWARAFSTANYVPHFNFQGDPAAASTAGYDVVPCIDPDNNPTTTALRVNTRYTNASPVSTLADPIGARVRLYVSAFGLQ